MKNLKEYVVGGACSIRFGLEKCVEAKAWVGLSSQEIFLAKNCRSIKKLNELMLRCAANIFGCGTAKNDAKGDRLLQDDGATSYTVR